MKKLPIIHHPNHAFSLVEVLVAIAILLLVVVQPMTMISQSNNSTAFANEQLVAFFLAQEGLEIVEKVRNDLYLQYFRQEITGSGGINNPMSRFRNSSSVQNVLGNCIGSNSDCGVQIANDGTVGAAISCSNANNNCRLYYQASNQRSKYVHGGGSAGAGQVLTPYTRTIRMIPQLQGGKLQEMQVISTVTWRTGSLISSQQVQLVTYLANIYDTD